MGKKSFINNESHIYSQKDLKCIDKKYLSVINPDKYEAKRLNQQEYDRNRDKTEERQNRDKSEKRRLMHQELDKKRDAERDKTEERQKRDKSVKRRLMHQELDKKRDAERDKTEERQKRDKTEKRRLMHQELDKKRDAERDKTEERQTRDKTEKRRLMHQELDAERDKTEKRQLMHKDVDVIRNKSKKRKRFFSDYEQTVAGRLYKKRKYNEETTKKILSTLDTDTGMDIICSSCLQYKQIEFCKSSTILSEEKQRKFLVKDYFLVKHKADGQFVSLKNSL